MNIEPREAGRRRRSATEPHRIVSLVTQATKPLVAISDFGRIVAINTIAAALLGLGGDALASEPGRGTAETSQAKREAASPRKARERIGQLLANYPATQQTRVRVKTSQFSGWLLFLERDGSDTPRA